MKSEKFDEFYQFDWCESATNLKGVERWINLRSFLSNECMKSEIFFKFQHFGYCPKYKQVLKVREVHLFESIEIYTNLISLERLNEFESLTNLKFEML